jgi:hypothetical protein
MRSRRVIQIRRIREWLTLSAAIALIPWTVYLSLTLPESYAAQHWLATWVGFDVLLMAFMIATAVLGFVRHHLLTLSAFTTGVLLVCDAWFDVLTARRSEFVASILIAALGELPLAVLLIVGALRIARLQASPSRRARRPRARRRMARLTHSRRPPERHAGSKTRMSVDASETNTS